MAQKITRWHHIPEGVGFIFMLYGAAIDNGGIAAGGILMMVWGMVNKCLIGINVLIEVHRLLALTAKAIAEQVRADERSGDA